jgi:hypothetical protein
MTGTESPGCMPDRTAAPSDGKAVGMRLVVDDRPKLFERDPRAGYLAMRRLTSLITHHLTPAGAR